MTPALSTEGLTVGYVHRRRRTAVLSDVSLTVPPGRLVCILGPNGAGKSTLLRTITGSQRPLAGTVEIDGRDLDSYGERELARRVSVVLTDRIEVGTMFGDELVALGRYPHTGRSGRLRARDRAAVRWAIDAVDAGALSRRRVGELSDGERQRLMVARALAQEPSLLVLDEPTAFLDLPRRVELIDLLATLAHGIGLAVVMSTHDLDLALRLADHLWLVDPPNGVVTGSPEHLAFSGALTTVFSTGNVVIDSSTGTLRPRRRHSAGRTVRITGTASAAVWADQLVERLGFERSRDVDGDVDVEIETIGADTATPGWRVRIEGRDVVCSDLGGLEAVLRHDRG